MATKTVKKTVAKKPVTKRAVTKTTKTVAKKPVAKRTTTRAKAAVPALKPCKVVFTKTGLIDKMAERAGIERKQAAACYKLLEDVMQASIMKGGLGVFTLPGLLKVKTRVKPAVKGGKKAINPFTKEEYITKSKPAKTIVKVLPMKKLKDAVL
jgi:nucleoid DNA-binding protein